MNRAFKLLSGLWNPSRNIIRHHPFPTPFIHFLQNQPTTQYTKLENGLMIATQQRENSPNTSIGIYIDAGSRYESPLENGMAYFFGHLLYKGTGKRSSHDLENSMNCLGANFRTFTTREMVGYYAECLTSEVPAVLDLLTDCVFNNTLLKEEIEMQKCVVYCEMLKYDENTNKVIYDYLHSSAFQGTPLANSVMGTSSNLYSFESHTINKYLSKYFDPTRTVLAAVGGATHEQIVKFAQCYLSYLKPIKNPDVSVYRYTGSDLRHRDDSLPLANIIVALEGPCFCDDDNIVMEVAKHVVGAWDRSQLSGDLLPWPAAQAASSGFCDAYKSFNINYKDTGLWGVQYISDPLNIDNMAMAIQDSWMYLCNCITEPEVERAKTFLMTKILIEYQSSTKLCNDIGRWTLYNGSSPSILEKLTAIKRVHAKDVREVCTRYLYARSPVVVGLGRVEGLNSYCRMLSGMYWLRT